METQSTGGSGEGLPPQEEGEGVPPQETRQEQLLREIEEADERGDKKSVEQRRQELAGLIVGGEGGEKAAGGTPAEILDTAPKAGKEGRKKRGKKENEDIAESLSRELIKAREEAVKAKADMEEERAPEKRQKLEKKYKKALKKYEKLLGSHQNSVRKAAGIEETEVQESEAESQELTPEQIAGDLTSSYWTNRLQETQRSMKTPDIRVQGGDFDMARSEAYLKNIREGKFFESVDVSGTYDGEPTQRSESSVYDFFKRIADSTERRIESFKDSPELVEKYKREGEEAQKIVEAMEKLKPAEEEPRARPLPIEETPAPHGEAEVLEDPGEALLRQIEEAAGDAPKVEELRNQYARFLLGETEGTEETAEETSAALQEEIPQDTLEAWQKEVEGFWPLAEDEFMESFLAALETMKEKGGNAKELLQSMVDNFVEIAGDKFPGIKELKKEQPEEFEKMKKGLLDAADIADPKERKQKWQEIIKENNFKGETERSARGLAEEIGQLKDKVGKKKIKPEEAKDAKTKLEELKGKAGALEKMLPTLGLVGAMILLSILVIIVLELEALNMLLGQTKGKR